MIPRRMFGLDTICRYQRLNRANNLKSSLG